MVKISKTVGGYLYSRLLLGSRGILLAAAVGIFSGALADTLDLATVTEGTIIPDNTVVTGTCDTWIRLDKGATVTLRDATVNGVIDCRGNAEIILEGDNVIDNSYGHQLNNHQPGIFVPANCTLVINGSGSLNVSAVDGAGIGAAGYFSSGGNITILGGTITAIGGNCAAGIGGAYQTSCGDINILGGTVTAIGGYGAAGIGGGGTRFGVITRCGDIRIGSGISRVTALCGSIHDSTYTWNNPIGEGFANREGGSVIVADGLIDSTDGNRRSITWNGDLSTRMCDSTIFDGMRIYGTLPGNYKLSIEDSAHVTLDGVAINGVNNADCVFAGLTCEGDADIILEEGSVNTVQGFYEDYPGIHVPMNKTLTIRGGGSLTASSNGYGAGIGGGFQIDCGSIYIVQGSVTASGGTGAAGIGGGMYGDCGTIGISAGITHVLAESSTNPIGPGSNGSGGSLEIVPGLSDTTSGSRRTIIPRWHGDLATVSDDVTAYYGATITGRLTTKHKVCIAAGATVTLKGADIMVDGVADDTSCNWAGLTCLGDATIILEGNNFVRGFYKNYPGIHVPSGSTLTIKGSGSLDADSNGQAAGIGGGYNVSCGSIDIQSGWVYAYGGDYAAGIGGGYNASCGDIHIGAGVAKVVATRGENGLYPIGGGSAGSGGAVSFGEGLTIDRDDPTWTITWGGDLSLLSGDVTAANGTVIHGTLSPRYKVSIAAGATVTLSGVTIAGVDDHQCKWAGLTCEGDATILLEGENVVRGFYHDYPGIYVPMNKTLTIRGVGALGEDSLHASSNGYGAGIGGGHNIDCGNIYIARCLVTATGGITAAGIGGGYSASCGNITITGAAAVIADGYVYAAGIGSGNHGTCGTISISSSINCVKATSGVASGTKPIGAGEGGTCGTVTVNGVGNYLTDTTTDTTRGQTRTIVWNGDLSKVTSDRIAFDGMKLCKTVGSACKISIDDGATVTISNATINGVNSEDYKWAGLTCLGDATIVLEGSNSLRGFYEDYPGIYVPTNKTLTIEGEGSLTAGSNGYGAGIGSGFQLPSGNIAIKGGTITANGGSHAAAGIGGVSSAACGAIAIKGGTVNATGGNSAPGIGALGNGVRCESIAIGAGITQVTATRGSGWTKNPIYDGGYAFADVPDGLRDETSNGGATRTIYSYWNGDLSQLESDMTVPDGMTVYGELQGDYNLSIEAGATVTLSNVVINGEDFGSYSALTCLGDAKLILRGANDVTAAGGYYYPGIFVPAGSTLEIDGDGSLEVEGGGQSAGIGGISNPSLDDTGHNGACGNIIIRGGRIVATGGYRSAGIGGSLASDCGNIQILGGDVWATGGYQAAGIGGGYGNGSIGYVEIGAGVIRVVASAGEDGGAPIGSGYGGNIRYVYVYSELPDDHGSPKRVIGAWDGDLSALGGDATAIDGTIIRGTLPANSLFKITIADGATVTLSNAVINGVNDSNCRWAGLTCLGDATIVLMGTSRIKGFYDYYPGIYVPENHTLTIDGDNDADDGESDLNASSNGYGAGIGGGNVIPCGSIRIKGGNVTAVGGQYAAGIGGGSDASFGDIWIEDGAVVATGGEAGIGSGGACYEEGNTYGNITISGGWVSAEGDGGAGIGCGGEGVCGDITITGGVVDAMGGERSPGIGCDGERDDVLVTITIGLGITQVKATRGDDFDEDPIFDGNSALVLPEGFIDTMRYDTRTIKPDPNNWDGNLDTVTENVTAADGTVIHGTLTGNYKVSIARGATVTLRNANITNGVNSSSYSWAGLTCEGGAVIYLEGTNTIQGFYEDYPGIYVPTNYILTIRGEGTLYAQGNVGTGGNRWAAGIGGGYTTSGNDMSCGSITISSGTVIATGGQQAAGIGSGYRSRCGNIRILSFITRVVATCGDNCDNTIGVGFGGTYSGDVPWIDPSLDDDEGHPTRTITKAAVSDPYAAWATANGVSGAWNATDANGIANVFRYAFNKPTGDLLVIRDIRFNDAGKAVIVTWPLVNSAGFVFTIEASDNVDSTGTAASYPLDASGETVIDETGKTTRFFRLKAVEQ